MRANSHELGVSARRAGSAEADSDAIPAAPVEAPRTFLARASGQHGDGDGAVADGPSVDAVADLGHGAAELVAHDGTRT